MSPLLLHSNTNQYNINGLLCTYTEMFRIQTCCNHILSAAEGFRGGGGGGGGVGGNMRGYFTKDPEAVHYFRGGGGCPTFFQGVQMLISIETHIHTYYFPGGVSGPPIPLWIHTWAMSSYKKNITGQYLSQSGL